MLHPDHTPALDFVQEYEHSNYNLPQFLLHSTAVDLEGNGFFCLHITATSNVQTVLGLTHTSITSPESGLSGSVDSYFKGLISAFHYLINCILQHFEFGLTVSQFL